MIIQIADAVSVEDCRRLMTMYDQHVHLKRSPLGVIDAIPLGPEPPAHSLSAGR